MIDMDTDIIRPLEKGISSFATMWMKLVGIVAVGGHSRGARVECLKAGALPEPSQTWIAWPLPLLPLPKLLRPAVGVFLFLIYILLLISYLLHS